MQTFWDIPKWKGEPKKKLWDGGRTYYLDPQLYGVAISPFSMFGLDSHFIHHPSTFNWSETIDFDMYGCVFVYNGESKSW